MTELTQDYLVEGYNRIGTEGKRHSVIAHTRGEKKTPKQKILEKVKHLKSIKKKIDPQLRNKQIKLLNIDLKQLKKSLAKAKKEDRLKDFRLLFHEIEKKQKQLDKLMLQKLGFDLIPIIFREDSKTIGEWISCCMHKHGPKGDGTMTHKQCIAAAHQALGKTKKDFTEDYPVQSHTRSGKPVKAHTRGEGKKEYSGRLIKITKSGRRYIEFASNEQIGGGTAKALRVKGIWIPRSQIITEEKKGGVVYIAEWLFNEKQRELVLNEIETLNRYIQEEKESIESAKESIKNPDRFTSLTKEYYEDLIKGFNKSIKKLEIRIKREEKKLKRDFILIPVIIPFLRTDNIPFSEFRQLKTDFKNQDFVIFHGPIVRDGPYDYPDENGNIKTLYKEIKNLSDIYSRYKYLPIKASEQIDAHHAEELGYAVNFSLNEETNEIEADLVLVNDENFKDVLRKKNEYHVSPGYNDFVKGNIQILTDVDHIALALGPETGRACTGTNSKGVSCTKVKKVNHDQNLTEVV